MAVSGLGDVEEEEDGEEGSEAAERPDTSSLCSDQGDGGRRRSSQGLICETLTAFNSFLGADSVSIADKQT